MTDPTAPERTPQDDTYVVTVNADGLRTVLNQGNLHAHQERGIWDDGNGEKSGTACRECSARDCLIAALDLARPMTMPPDDTTEPATTEDGYWEAEAQRARAERDALALRLLQMADAWQERFTGAGIRAEVAADAIRAAVENMGGR